MVDALSSTLIRLFWHYKAGYLPRPGGLLDQPNAFIEAAELIESVQGEITRAEAENVRRQSKNNYRR